MMNSEDVLEVRAQLRKVLTKSLLPQVESSEETGEFCSSVHRELGGLGLLAPIFPEEFGGADNLYLQLAVAEEFGYFCNGFGLSSLASTCLFGANVARHGTLEQKKKYLPGIASGEKMGCWALTEPMIGSDAVGIQTTAVKKDDHYLVNGTKTFITNAPIGDHFIVIAKEPPAAGATQNANGFNRGIALILERTTPGLKTGQAFKKMGHRSSPTGEVFLENVKVPLSQVLGERGRAFHDMKYSLDVERIVFSGLATGMMKFCIEKTLKYTSERQQFGKAISDFQMVQDKIAQMMVHYESAREYLYMAIDRLSKGESVVREAAVAKLLVAESVRKVTDMAVQCHGGYGYIEEYQVERCLRDSKLFEIGAGTSEIQKLIIAKQTFKDFLGK